MVHSSLMPIATNSDKIILNSEKDTKEFAENFLIKIKPNCIVFIYGEMGVGKTTFIKYLVNAFQKKNKVKITEVTSPTFNFLNQYDWIKKSQKCRELNFWAKEKINHLLKNKELSHNKFLGQMNSFYINQNATIDYHIYFYKKYKIQIPFIIWNKKSLMRVSIQVYNSEEAWSASDCTKKELMEFIEQLTSNQFQTIENFFTTMPKLVYKTKVKNPETKKDNDIVIEGLSNFFA